MRIRIKLILLVSILIFIFTAIILTYQFFSNQYLIKFFNAEMQEQKESFQDIVLLKQATLKALAYDYTLWDAMADFVKTHDQRWAQENIDTGLETFNVNAAWVYNLDGTLVYSTNNIESKEIKDLPELKQAVLQLKGKPQFPNFFVETPNGIMRIEVAPIQPSSDIARVSPPMGYFLVGRLWNEAFLKELTRLTHSQMEWDPTSPAQTQEDIINPEKGHFIFSKNLSGFDGKFIGHYRVTMESSGIRTVNQAVYNTVTFFVFAMMVIFVVLTISLIYWVNIPLYSLTTALRSQNASELESLKNKRNEFGDIARLTVEFFNQRAALLQSEERYRLIFQTAGSLIVSLDKLGHIVNCNNKVSDLLGYKILEVINQPFTKFIEPGSVGMMEHLLHTAIPGAVQSYEWRMVRQDGQYIDVLFNASRMEHDAGIICIIYDITRRKNTEAELKRVNMELAQEEVKLRNLLLNLEKKNIELQETRSQFLQSAKMAAVGRLSAGVAHEIKNPLAIILLGIEKVDKESKVLSPNARQAIDMIKAATERANTVIKELLYFSRNSAIDLNPLDIHQVIRKSIILVENTSRLKNIQIQLNFSDSIVGKIAGDEILLEQVFLNLFVNALDAMEGMQGGIINIRSYLKQVDSETSPNVVVEVSDTGSGMTREVLARIFEPFFTTKDQGKGTGLGLSTVFMIMEKHYADIQVDSKEGQGTKFTLIFPVLTEEKKA